MNMNYESLWVNHHRKYSLDSAETKQIKQHLQTAKSRSDNSLWGRDRRQTDREHAWKFNEIASQTGICLAGIGTRLLFYECIVHLFVYPYERQMCRELRDFLLQPWNGFIWSVWLLPDQSLYLFLTLIRHLSFHVCTVTAVNKVFSNGSHRFIWFLVTKTWPGTKVGLAPNYIQSNHVGNGFRICIDIL